MNKQPLNKIRIPKILLIMVCVLLSINLSACAGSKASSNTPSVDESEVSTDTNEQPADDDTSEDSAVAWEVTSENTYDPKTGMLLDYPYIDPTTLDATAIGWGMGPDRDELNRPITALQYQDEYADCYVDFIIPTEKKTIYLTFDEGYENGYSESILDTLSKHNAKAVFFVTKPYAESSPELVGRMIDDGHIIGNHTVHHPADGLTEYDIDYQTNEVTETHSYIKDNFGYDMFLFRYPTGKFSRQSLAVVSNCGYRSVFWSFAYADWDTSNQPEPSAALLKLENSLHPGAIYLLHAVSQTNASILDDFLTYAEQNGYTFGSYADTLN